MFIDSIFKRTKVNIDKLLNYGFLLKDDLYQYDIDIMDNDFHLTVLIDMNGNVSTKVIEKEINEEYILYKIENVSGEFALRVRKAVENVLYDIKDKCFQSYIFKSLQASLVIEYIKTKYDIEFEFLWDKLPECAIARNKITKKWFCLLGTIPKNKIIGKDNIMVDVMNLTIEKENMNSLMERNGYYPGWHMNKKSWYTIILDDSLAIEDIHYRIDESYRISSKK